MKNGKNQKTIQQLSSPKSKGWKTRLREKENAEMKKDLLLEKVLKEGSRKVKAQNSPAFTLGFDPDLYKKAPRLFDLKEYQFAVKNLAEVQAHLLADGVTLLRPVSEWVPKGKSRETLFVSLVNHCFGKYPLPPLFTQLLFGFGIVREYNGLDLWRMLAHVGAGGSLWDFLKKSPAFPVPLTKKQCHLLLTAKTEPFIHGLRRVQVQSLGASRSFFEVVKDRWDSLKDRYREAFRCTIIDFFARNPMVPADQIEPLLDYIEERWSKDFNFTLKGRSILALQRGMEEWHRELGKEKNLKEAKVKVFEPSGFKDGTYDHSSNKGTLIWRVSEVLTAKELHAEGKRMGHCVFSYLSQIALNRVSIWSLTKEDGTGDTGNWAMLTVEVDNVRKEVVQYRGRFNRTASREEVLILSRWATENSLRLRPSW